MFKLLCSVFFISIVNLCAQTDFKLIAELVVKAKSGEVSGLRELHKESLDKKNNYLRKYLVKFVALSMLNNSSKATTGYFKKVTSGYATENLLGFLQQPPIQIDCTLCKAFGKKLKPCIKCKDGACRNCKGEGAIIYGNGKSRKESPCASCESSGNCVTCKGTGDVVAKCRACVGKGHRMNKIIFRKESDRALEVLLNKVYELDGDPSTVFDAQLLKEDEEYVEKYKAELKAREARWRELEIIRCGTVKFPRQGKKGPNSITTDGEEIVENYVEGGSTPTLDHVCLEITEYLKAQELKSKQKFLIKVYGQFLNDVPTVHVAVSENFTTASYDYKLRAADGFYRFAALRAQANGYEEIDFKLLSNDGTQIGGVNEKGFWVKK